MLPEIISKRVIKLALAILAVVLVLYISYVFLDIIIMLTISVLLALMFNPVVNYFCNKGFTRFASILTVVMLISIFSFIILSFIIPKIALQIEYLSTSLTQSNYRLLFTTIEDSIRKIFPFIKRGTINTKIEDFFSALILNSLDSVSNLVSSLVSIIAILVIVPFMTFFLLKDNKSIVKGILNIMPNKYFEMSYWIIRKMSIQLGRFVRGWLLDAFIVGLLSAVGLSVLGIDSAIPIGIIAGVGHLIPYFGPIIGGIPAILISALQFGDFSMLPSILILFIIIYTIDNGFVQPNVFAKNVDMHPLVIIILIIAGSQLMGVIGMLLAVPIATVLKTAAREIYHGFRNYSITRSRWDE